MNALDIKHLTTLIKEIKVAMLTTSTPDGEMRSCPMITQEVDAKNFDGKLWFFSRKNSQKNYSIQKDQRVCLNYARPDKNHYVAIHGRASISNDRQLFEKFWNPSMKVWFPEGLMDPNLTLISVTVDSAEIWDVPLTKTSQVVNAVKSAITGRHDETGPEGEHLEFVPDEDDSDLMTEDEKLDQTLKESFPASDPPGHFAKSAEDLRQY